MGLKKKSFLNFCPRYSETDSFDFFMNFADSKSVQVMTAFSGLQLIAFSGGRVYTSVDPCVAGMMPEAIIDE